MAIIHIADLSVPEVCRFCGGEQTMPVIEMRGDVVTLVKTLPCPWCCCDICEQPTDTPPVCARCDEEQR